MSSVATSKFHGRAQEAAAKIFEAFQSGQLPKALAPIFIHRKDDVPCRSWSWGNQLITAVFGHIDARGMRQWNEVGRSITKGEHGFPILVPLLGSRTRVDEATGEEEDAKYVYGYKHAIVFGYEQTEGDPLPVDTEAQRFVDSLPLIEVARSWGLSVETFNGKGKSYLGCYIPGSGIALGTKNLSTWAHELMHAADQRCTGPLKREQKWDQEIVAELGGAILLEALGFAAEADRGGCWEYLQRYAEKAEMPAFAACQILLKRMCDAVALVLDTADKIAEEPSEATLLCA